jgi:hypothetical protein
MRNNIAMMVRLRGAPDSRAEVQRCPNFTDGGFHEKIKEPAL